MIPARRIKIADQRHVMPTHTWFCLIFSDTESPVMDRARFEDLVLMVFSVLRAHLRHNFCVIQTEGRVVLFERVPSCSPLHQVDNSAAHLKVARLKMVRALALREDKDALFILFFSM